MRFLLTALTTLILYTGFSLPSYAQNSLCVPSNTVTTTSVAQIVSDLILENDAFEVLRGTATQAPVQIEVVEEENDDETYFRAFFSIISRINPFEEPLYRVYFNEAINDCPPSYDAVKAIVAHELFHIVDYVESNNLELIELGLTYGPAYERETDVSTVYAGYGPGLIDFRYWIYSVLPDAEAIAKKKEYYLTPEEIQAIMDSMNTSPLL